MTIQATLNWMEFMRESTNKYNNLIVNNVRWYEQLIQMASIHYMETMQKTLKENESIPN